MKRSTDVEVTVYMDSDGYGSPSVVMMEFAHAALGNSHYVATVGRFCHPCYCWK